jgi:GNAT superfamily N-acetyltransferase
MADDFVVVTDHPSLIDFVDGLQRKNAEALAFYPRAVFEREQRAGRLFLGLLNGEPCGYIYAGAQTRDVKCHQVCIQYDARRRLYGMALVQLLEAYANDGKASTVTLRCGFDIEANDFWRSLGYGTVAVHDGGIRRMRRINVWQKQLMPGLFEPIYMEPEHGKTSAAIWAKHKDTGIVTQFIRGKKMAQYRAVILARAEAELPIADENATPPWPAE